MFFSPGRWRKTVILSSTPRSIFARSMRHFPMEILREYAESL